MSKTATKPTEHCGVSVVGKRIGPRLPLETFTVVCSQPKGHHATWHEGEVEGKPFRFSVPVPGFKRVSSLKDLVDG